MKQEPFIPLNSEMTRPTLLELKCWTDRFDGLTAGFTTRQGGASAAPYNSLNMALHVSDDEEDVVANRKLLCEAIQMPFEAFTCAEQVHGHRVHHVVQAERGKGRLLRADAIVDADAIVTKEVDICLVSYYADCVPLLFVDPMKRVIGLAHAGWKGTVQQIAVNVVEQMMDRYQCDPKQIQVAIGPSIGKCCYEVDERVILPVEQVMQQLSVDPQFVLDYRDNGCAMVDLREINRQLLLKAGILPTHIECTTWCTSCSTELFFSHRAEHGRTGRMASWIGWKKG